ncbi:hypothetical protein DPSP01_001839 [Paraphaeosphaeria sporulosa]
MATNVFLAPKLACALHHAKLLMSVRVLLLGDKGKSRDRLERVLVASKSFNKIMLPMVTQTLFRLDLLARKYMTDFLLGCTHTPLETTELFFWKIFGQNSDRIAQGPY